MKTELLAPAGDMQSVIQAVQNGADAVYLGGKSFGARAFAANFSYDELKTAVTYAHTYGVHIYVTVNTLIYEEETKDFLLNVEQILKTGADALIMQDVGMIDAVCRRFPEAVIHSSTQMHNHNDASLEFDTKLGLKRAVLAREMSIEQIQKLKCTIEKEVFVHGALCISYSGQCLFSALTNGRSGNRGTCAQSCRMRFKLIDEDNHRYQTNGEYLLSPKDIGLFENIRLLLNAGVSSFKIEGRMKSPEYVGLVTKIYAKIIEDNRAGRPFVVNAQDKANLMKLFNRGYSQAHLLSIRGEELMSKRRPNHRGIRLGEVLALTNSRISLRLSASLNQGDGIKFEKNDDGFICNKIFKNGLLVSSAYAGETIELEAKAKTFVGDSVVKTSDSLLHKELQIKQIRRVPIKGSLTAKIGCPLRLAFTDQDGHITDVLGQNVEPCRTRPTTKEDLHSGISKLGATPYCLEHLDIDMDDDIFVVKSVLNALRRDAVAQLTQLRTEIQPIRVCHDKMPIVNYSEETNDRKLHVLVRSFEQFEAIKDMVTGDIYTEDVQLYFNNKTQYPNLRIKTDRFAETSETYKDERLLVTDHGGLYFYQKNNDVILDHTVYALNAHALNVLVAFGAKRIALSAELNTIQAAQMIKAYKEHNNQPAPMEAILWARYELMGMRQCVLSGALGKASCGLCKKKRFYLEDIKGSRFPIIMDKHCQSHIFHSRIVKADADEYMKLGVQHYRIELFDEDAEQSKSLVLHYLKTLKG